MSFISQIRKWNKSTWAGFLLMMGGVGLILIYFGPQWGTNSTTQDPRWIRDFTLEDASGKPFRIRQAAGKPVVVHFWAKWCAPCIEEIPAILKFARDLENDPVLFVLVSMDSKWEDAHEILPSQGLPKNMISLLDPKGITPEIFGSFQYPETYFLDERQRIESKWVGPQNWSHPSFKARLQKQF